jgi:hypothetical protein
MIIDTSILDTWDAAIVERFDSIRSGASSDRAPCVLELSVHCLVSLDQTLNDVRRRSQHRSVEGAATGDELTALRSAAVEVAAGAYVDGVRKRRRPGPMVAPSRNESARRTDFDTVVCLLPQRLIEDLDEVLAGFQADELREARSVVVESAITSWLILRGYAAAVPPGERLGGWLAAVKVVVSRRRRRSR